MNVPNLVFHLSKLGYEQQVDEEHCDFKVIINNCKETEFYFRKDALHESKDDKNVKEVSA